MALIFGIDEHEKYRPCFAQTKGFREFYLLYPIRNEEPDTEHAYDARTWVPDYLDLKHGKEYSVLDLKLRFGMTHHNFKPTLRFLFQYERHY